MIEVEHREVQREWGMSRELVDRATGKYPVVGDMFFAPWILTPGPNDVPCLAPKYWALPEPRRAPIAVICPGGHFFCIDTMAYEHPRGYYGDGWTITGEPPALTVSPSIDLKGRWHGYLKAGVFQTC